MPAIAQGISATHALREQVASGDVYELLALFLQTPTKELFSGLESGAIRDDLRTILSELGWKGSKVTDIIKAFDRIKEDIQEERYTYFDVRSEHTRLFNHPKNPAVALYEGVFLEEKASAQVIPPHASKHRDISQKFQKDLGKQETSSLIFVNRAALDAERCYRQAGLKRTSEHNVPADCMYTEMAFMGYLHTQKAKALVDNDRTKLAQVDAQLEEFTHLHLKKWATDFYRKCQRESVYTLYQATGMLGEVMLRTVLAH